jgi:hypothetical protein
VIELLRFPLAAACAPNAVLPVPVEILLPAKYPKTLFDVPVESELPAPDPNTEVDVTPPGVPLGTPLAEISKISVPLLLKIWNKSDDCDGCPWIAIAVTFVVVGSI